MNRFPGVSGDPAGTRADAVRHRPRPLPDPGPAPGSPDPAGPDPARVDPAVLGALLDRHGWRRRGGTAGRYARWSPPGAADGRTSLLIPETRTLPDCDDLVGEAIGALTALARDAVPSARDVLAGLTVPGDEIHWWREVPPGPAGAVPWAAQERLRTAARQLLMAGALAAHGRAGYHGARHRRRARALLDGVLVAPGAGGRSLTALVPVAGGRALAVALYGALAAARDATDYQRATGRTEAYDAAVAVGVSQELTEGLVALVHGSEGAAVRLAWSPAAGTPEGCAARPAAVEFTPGDLPALRAAGARYVRHEPSVPVRVTGAVVGLRRPGPHGPGAVKLRVLTGAEVPQVRAVLEEDAYRIAGQAHLAGVPIRVNGRLESRGGFRRLTDASGVLALPAEGPEAEQLLKSLGAEPGDAR
ncbi:hypothetical protein ACFYXL_17385 [Streptomyces tsukubensis]|uniref:hypothetical protein n=1 Tax=Streptomyces tsukubensis TaxID=83656 RepID=UPI00369D50FD